MTFQMALTERKFKWTPLHSAMMLAFMMHFLVMFMYIVFSPEKERDDYTMFREVEIVNPKDIMINKEREKEIAKLKVPPPPPPPPKLKEIKPIEQPKPVEKKLEPVITPSAAPAPAPAPAQAPAPAPAPAPAGGSAPLKVEAPKAQISGHDPNSDLIRTAPPSEHASLSGHPLAMGRGKGSLRGTGEGYGTGTGGTGTGGTGTGGTGTGGTGTGGTGTGGTGDGGTGTGGTGPGGWGTGGESGKYGKGNHWALSTGPGDPGLVNTGAWDNMKQGQLDAIGSGSVRLRLTIPAAGGHPSSVEVIWVQLDDPTRNTGSNRKDMAFLAYKMAQDSNWSPGTVNGQQTDKTIEVTIILVAGVERKI